MNREEASLEAALSSLTPARLEQRLFLRLSESLENGSQPAPRPAPEFEASLARIRPARLSPALDARLADLVAGEAPRIVEMPAPRRLLRFPGIAAAAAVAILGALAALFAPIGGRDATPALTAARSAPVASQDPGFIPAGYARGFSEAQDHGLVWQNDRPHRVLRIIYLDTITLRNAAGETVEVEQPRVEYVLLPQKID